MNWLIILGIVVIGFGTYFIYLGTDLNNQKSQENLVKKIEQTQSTIENLKNLPKDDSLKTKIVDIENEFHKWADEFLKNKETKKLLVEKQKLSSKEKRINLSDKWLPGYIAFFDVLKKSIDAYNYKTNSKIEYNIPSIPRNIFVDFEKEYSCFIIFKVDVIWELIIGPPKKLEKEYFPEVYLYIYDRNALNKDFLDKKSSATDILSLLFYSSNSKMGIHKFINTRFNLEYLKPTYDITTPEETLSEIARDLIEAQLLQL